ncbi:MAG: DUF1846 domain-containing protein [Erysipelotrichaceae bacterium]
MRNIAFDNNQYLNLQSTHIKERIASFDNKLYLEFGGKLFDDNHASRVLPGFEPDSKLKMLLQLKDQVEIIIAINATDIEKNKVRSDLGITYDVEVLRLIDAFRNVGLYVGSVVISQYAGQSTADAFKSQLIKLGINVAMHYPIKGYPHNIETIVSDEGYGKNEYVETTKPLVVVTAPGPGSGKMATCLSQLYHEYKRGVKAGYAKFETFPIWNLPLKHPVNLAYEAATVDLNDVNMIDPFHLEAYNEIAINYNRDVEIFPVLNAMLETIMGESPYKSPTDMGVNMAGKCIIDDAAAMQASRQEIIRRYYQTLVEVRRGKLEERSIEQMEILLGQANTSLKERRCIQACLDRVDSCATPALAMELLDGTIVTGKTTNLLGASAAVILNALKHFAGIPKDMPIISPSIIEPISQLKTTNLGNNNPRLHADEILIALAISATTNPLSHKALEQLPKLHFSEAHSSVILSEVDTNVFRKLKINLTSEPKYQTKKLYHK